MHGYIDALRTAGAYGVTENVLSDSIPTVESGRTHASSPPRTCCAIAQMLDAMHATASSFAPGRIL